MQRTLDRRRVRYPPGREDHLHTLRLKNCSTTKVRTEVCVYEGAPSMRIRKQRYPWQRRHVQGDPLHAFSNYAVNQENEIGKMSSINMCQGVSFADLVSMIPEHLRPSNDS